MFAYSLKAAIEGAARCDLPKITSALYKGLDAGIVTQGEAEELDALIGAKLALPPRAPRKSRVGTRPRTSASMERRRMWAASRRLPPRIAAHFTLAEQAVLAVVAAEAAKRGDCRLHMDHLAALAGVCRTTVKKTLRLADELGLVRVAERRLTAWRNDSNVVAITSPEWRAWLRLGGGGRIAPRTTNEYNPLKAQANGFRERQGGGATCSGKRHKLPRLRDLR